MELGLKLENLMKTAKHGELLLIKNKNLTSPKMSQVIKQGSKRDKQKYRN
jgi:hypothetical protein